MNATTNYLESIAIAVEYAIYGVVESGEYNIDTGRVKVWVSQPEPSHPHVFKNVTVNGLTVGLGYNPLAIENTLTIACARGDVVRAVNDRLSTNHDGLVAEWL